MDGAEEEDPYSTSQLDEDDSDDEATNEDIDKLKVALRNEKACPEILAFEEEVVSDIHELVKAQQGHVDEFRDGNDDTDTAFAISLYQMEIDRIQYMLSAYLRARLLKIEEHVLHILKDTELVGRLSPKELVYAKGYFDMIESHFNDTVLDQLPKKFKLFTDKSADHNMIPEPNLDEFVFCRITEELGLLQLDEKGEQKAELNKDDVHILQYRPISSFVASGSIELI